MKRYVVVVAASIAFAGCADMQRPSGRPLESMETGILVGAGIGAALGAVAYHQNRSRGALIGAVGGGLAGAAVGSYMDSQKRDLEKNLGQEIQSGEARVEKMPNDVVRITMTSHTAFDTDSVNIKPAFHSTMDKLADVVVRYGKTTLTIVGHTDNVGSNQYNQKLSERRAVSVAQYFESRHVSPLRLATLGKGEGEPVASNNTESGRSANRRVEIYVEPIVGG
ncbi:MAG: OmpA family protein [Betaproteobacteria bacterium]|nr:MAG: OmpA family protein [Betaproteobacteria bacterium]